MDFYGIKARERERQFLKRAKNQFYLTGAGARNQIVSVDATSVYFLTRRSEVPQRISRHRLREAIRFLYFRRTVTRMDIEKRFKSCFSSAMLGLLRMLFIGIARIHKPCKGARMRLTLKSVRHVYSGAERAPKDLMLAIQNGARFFLISYAHVRDRPKWYKLFETAAVDYGIKLLIDSGAFTIHQARKKGQRVKPIRVEEYADFLERYRHLIYGHFNLDVIADPEASAANAAYLRDRGLEPIDVFHFGSSWDELGKMVSQDREVIGIGGTVGLPEKTKRTFFTELFDRFPGQLFHLLGCGSALITEFPFFSSDSSTWLLGRKFRFILTPKQVPAPANWSGDDCVAHNVRFQAQLEFLHEAVQLELPMAN